MSEHTDTGTTGDTPNPDRRDSDILQEAGFLADHRKLMVCAVCGELFSRDGHPTTGKTQKCHCHRSGGDARWEGFDYNEFARLCLCCGRTVLRSGSRWSVWFCAECKEPIRGFNLTYGWEGTAVIPIGRHSLMNNIALAPQEVEDIRGAVRFVGEFKDLAGRTSHLFDWGRERVRRNLTIARLDGSAAPLQEYLLATGRAALTDPNLGREAALLGLMGHFGATVTPADLPVFRDRIEARRDRFDAVE